MRNGVLIGIDAGTTVFKAAAFHVRTGNVLAVATRRMPIRTPDSGRYETPPKALDRALRSTLIDLRVALGKRWDDACGVGLAAQGGSTIFADRESGKPLTDMILWNDGRAFGERWKTQALKRRSWWRARLLNDWMPAGLERLAWMKRHCPGVFENRNAIHVGAGEYLFHRMTGVWRQDAGNAIQIGSYDAAKGKLTDDMLKLVGFSLSRVATLRDGHTTVALGERFAKRFDLAPGIPVAGPYIDQEAALQSVQGVGARPLQCSLGTAWVGNFSLPSKRVGTASMQFVLRGANAGERMIVLPLLTGNTAWDWALTRFVDTDIRKALQKAETTFGESLLPPPGMVCIPFFLHGNPIDYMHAGAGVFYGVSARATASDFVRAVACGLCCELLRVFQQVKTRKRVDSVIISGGASKADFFRTIIATLFVPLPVYVQQNEDTAAARGALVGFNTRMSKSPVTRIAPAKGALASQIMSTYSDYENTFQAIYKGDPLASPYSFAKERA